MVNASWYDKIQLLDNFSCTNVLVAQNYVDIFFVHNLASTAPADEILIKLLINLCSSAHAGYIFQHKINHISRPSQYALATT